MIATCRLCFGGVESQTDTGRLPARTMQEGNARIWFAAPEDQGVPTEAYLLSADPNSNQIAIFNRQAGTVNDGNGDPHIAMVSVADQTYQYGGTDIRIGHG